MRRFPEARKWSDLDEQTDAQIPHGQFKDGGMTDVPGFRAG
jgi:hypothetical protein